jgi:hypothetical protein
VTSEPFALRFDPLGEELAAARACEIAVFRQTYGNTAQQWHEEYGPYETASVFITILEPAGDAVASCRLIRPNRRGLKSLVDIEREPWLVDANRSAAAAGMSPAATWDVATVAVRRGVAGPGVLSAALYHGIVAATRANHLRWVVMIMDARARRLLSMLDLETHVLPGTRTAPYLGSAASVPLYADVNHMMDRQRRLNPGANRVIERGLGLGAIELPDAGGFVVSRSVPAPVDFVPRSVRPPGWSAQVSA